VQHANPKDDHEQMALAHLIEVANRDPEVCVVLDDRGNMSAWGLESVGSKHRKPGDVFNIAHAEGMPLQFTQDVPAAEAFVQFHNLCCDGQKGAFTLLAHHFDGRVEYLEGRLDQLFDLSPRQNRMSLKAKWMGHSHAVKKVVRTARGRALVSRTDDNETMVWVQNSASDGTSLSLRSKLMQSEHIHRMVLLQEGDFVVLLHHESISIWDTRSPRALEVARSQYSIRGKPLCLIIVPEIEANSRLIHLATMSSEMKGIAWEVRLPPKGTATNGVDNVPSISLRDFDTFELGTGDNLKYVLPVDPAGSAPVISGFLDTFARDVALSYTHSGQIKTWSARVNMQERKLDWVLTATVETSIDNPSLASGTSIRKAALVSAERNTLTIWNTKSALLEHEEHFEGQGDVQDLDWSSTPDNQSVLAVGFPHRVAVYAQLRYDYFDAGPAWMAIREIKIRDLTPHPIGDSVWLGSGNLVIGAGNQLFVQDDLIEVGESLLPDLRDSSRKHVGLRLFNVVSRLNGPLPIYHPQFLAQCILAGKVLLVQRIFIKLFKFLKFFTEGEEVENLLSFSPEDFWNEQEVRSMAPSGSETI